VRQVFAAVRFDSSGRARFRSDTGAMTASGDHATNVVPRVTGQSSLRPERDPLAVMPAGLPVTGRPAVLTNRCQLWADPFVGVLAERAGSGAAHV
jgi:hypothetical protein